MRVSLSTLALLSTIRQAGCTDLDESLIEMANPGTSQESVQELFRKLLDIKGEFSNFFLNAEEDTEKSRGFLSRFDEIAKQISELDRPDDAESTRIREMARSYLDNIKKDVPEKDFYESEEKHDALHFYYSEAVERFTHLLKGYYVGLFESIKESYRVFGKSFKTIFSFDMTEDKLNSLKLELEDFPTKMQEYKLENLESIFVLLHLKLNISDTFDASLQAGINVFLNFYIRESILLDRKFETVLLPRLGSEEMIEKMLSDLEESYTFACPFLLCYFLSKQFLAKGKTVGQKFSPLKQLLNFFDSDGKILQFYSLYKDNYESLLYEMTTRIMYDLEIIRARKSLLELTEAKFIQYSDEQIKLMDFLDEVIAYNFVLYFSYIQEENDPINFRKFAAKIMHAADILTEPMSSHIANRVIEIIEHDKSSVESQALGDIGITLIKEMKNLVTGPLYKLKKFEEDVKNWTSTENDPDRSITKLYREKCQVLLVFEEKRKLDYTRTIKRTLSFLDKILFYMPDSRRPSISTFPYDDTKITFYKESLAKLDEILNS